MRQDFGQLPDCGSAAAPPRRLLQPFAKLWWFLLVSLWLGLLAQAPGAWAHESRPAYLETTETTPGRYGVLWRTPLLAGMRLPVVLKFPDNVRNVTEPALRELPDSLIERQLVKASGSGLAGKRIEFVGLQATITDVLVRVQLHDGVYSTTLVHPSQSWNVGVELGQLVFIGLVLSVLALVKRMKLLAVVGRYALPVATYTIGILAAFWFFEGLARFVT